jgi:hypothetical protein
MQSDAMAIRTVQKRVYRNGNVRYVPEGQAEPDTAKSLERDGLIKEESDGFTVLDAGNLRVVCWQITMNEHCRRLSIGEPFTGISARLLNVVEHKMRQ